jgi:hypothetical protein
MTALGVATGESGAASGEGRSDDADICNTGSSVGTSNREGRSISRPGGRQTDRALLLADAQRLQSLDHA